MKTRLNLGRDTILLETNVLPISPIVEKAQITGEVAMKVNKERNQKTLVEILVS